MPNKRNIDRANSAMKKPRMLQIAICMLMLGILLSALAADYPAWWSERGVVDETRPPQDHHPVNQGQVKWMATRAAAEFSAKLPSPKNAPINRTCASFPTGSNHRPANLGMLKNAAKPFYERLIDLDYTDGFPWEGGTPDDYALANQGQLKNLFAFELDIVPADWRIDHFGSPDAPEAAADADTDGDGLTVLQEYLHGADPNSADSSGDGLPDGLKVAFDLDPFDITPAAQLAPDGAGGYRWETSFSAAEGYAPGDLDGQDGWLAAAACATPRETAAFNTASNAFIEHYFEPSPAQTLWLSFRARFTPGPMPEPGDFDARPIALAMGCTAGSTLALYDPAIGGWNEFHMPDGVADWNNYAFRLDYAESRALLGVNGYIVKEEIPFANSFLSTLARLRVQQEKSGPRGFGIDDITVSTAPPSLHYSSAGDGVPDWWKQQYFQSATAPGTGADDDFDGDGIDNEQEYRLRIDPANPSTSGDGIPDGEKLALGLDLRKFYFTPANAEALTRQVWREIPGKWVSSLVSNADFPYHPDVVHELKNLFEAYSNVGDNYGQRIAGRFRAPLDGDYTFWIASDDRGQLWITDDAQRSLIASVPGYTAPRQWNKFAAQQSSPVELQAGESYPLEALMKERGGRDNLAVGVRLPDGRLERPIRARRFLDPPAGISFTNDADADGLSDYEEWVCESDPNNPDTSGDGLTDYEKLMLGLDPTVKDSDGDGIPDWWLLEYGMDPLADNTMGDPDGDGLSNLDEYFFGTDPSVPDTDGDGITDGEEVIFYHSNPLEVDFDGTSTQLLAVQAASTNSAVGGWSVDGTDLVADNRDGKLSYELDVSAAGVYRLEVVFRENSRVSPPADYGMIARVDGEYCGRRDFAAQTTVTNELHFVTPWLTNGLHDVELRIENINDYAHPRLMELRLVDVGGPDADSNGRADWIDHRMATVATVDTAPAASHASPACIEGRGLFLNKMSISDGTPVQHGAGHRWYADLPLSETTAIEVDISFQDGYKTVPVSIAWQPVNLLAHDLEEPYLIRAGDALRFTAAPAGATNGIVDIAIDGGTSYQTAVGAPATHTFTDAGTYTVTGTYSDGADSATGSLEIAVMSAEFPEEEPGTWLDMPPRAWKCPDIPLDVWLESDRYTELVRAGAFEGGSLLEVALHEVDDDHHVVARLAEGAPILASKRLAGFWYERRWDGTAKVIEYLEDGSRVVEDTIKVGYFPSYAYMVYHIFAGGGVLEDGTTRMTIYPSDLDENGEIKVRLIVPPGSNPCSRVYIYNSDTLVGTDSEDTNPCTGVDECTGFTSGPTFTMEQDPPYTNCFDNTVTIGVRASGSATYEMRDTGCHTNSYAVTNAATITSSWKVVGFDCEPSSGEGLIAEFVPLEAGSAGVEFDITASIGVDSNCTWSITTNTTVNFTVVDADLAMAEYIGIDMTGDYLSKTNSKTATATVVPNDIGFSWDSDFDAAEFDPDPPDNDSTSAPIIEVDNASGSYTNEAVIFEAGPGPCSVTSRFTVVKVNVEMQGLEEDEEESIGGLVHLNADDDDDNGVLDKDQDGPVTNEDDLVQFTVEILPHDLPTNDTVTVTGTGIYHDDEKEFPMTNNVFTLTRLAATEFYLEGTDVSSSPTNFSVQVTHTDSGATDRALYTVIRADIDIDSDNTSDFGGPYPSDFEESIEVGSTNPVHVALKYVVVDDYYDADTNGIPGYADGYDNDGTDGNADDAISVDGPADNEVFVPIQVRVDHPFPIDGTTIEFTYAEGGDPTNVVSTIDADGVKTWEPSGKLRIWTAGQNGSRDSDSVVDDGDFVPRNTEISLDDLNIEIGTPKTLYVEGLACRDYLAAESIAITVINTNLVEGLAMKAEDEIKFTIIKVDVDVDTDNDDGFDLPEGASGPALAEDHYEDIAGSSHYPGKLMAVNDNDDDGDGIPDFADGYSLGLHADDNVNTNEQFVQIVFNIPEPVDLTKAKVKLTYDESDPLGVTTNSAGEYVIPGGHLRIWTNAPTAERDGHSIVNQGDYIPSGEYDAEAFGFTNGTRVLTYYLEGVTNSQQIADQQIIFEVDPDGDVAGKPYPEYIAADAVRMTVIKMGLVPNYDRDDRIDSDDIVRAAKNEIFRFWINDDDDSGYEGGSDTPGDGSADFANNEVDGVRDLVDFFPVWLDLRDALSVLGTNEYNYILTHANGALNAFACNALPVSSNPDLKPDSHLYSQNFANTYGTYSVEQITASGMMLPSGFLSEILNFGRGIVMLESRAATQAPLVLEIRKKSDNTVICKEEMAVSIDGVEEMYRFVDMRDFVYPYNSPEPSNYPDSLCESNKDFVFVHGNNADLDGARAWNAEVFKRLWWSGSGYRYHGIAWLADEGSNANYQQHVHRAFMTAECLADYVDNALPSAPVIAAQSLGNVVCGSAIQDHGMPYSKYFIINAAVPMEAYDGTQADSPHPHMEHPDWTDYERGTWSADWYKLFEGTSDIRAELKWKGRFAGAVVNAYNIYSSSDEVFDTKEGVSILSDPGLLPGGTSPFHHYSWQIQELLKGVKGRLFNGALFGLGATDMAGWGFNLTMLGTREYSAEEANTTLADNPDLLKTEPVFRPEPNELFTVMDVTKKNEILAKGIPALSRAAGKENVGTIDPVYNINLNTTAMRPNGTTHTDDAWFHNDMKNLPYLQSFKLYEKLLE